MRPSHFTHLKPIGQRLLPILADHLGEDPEDVDPNYGNKLIGNKFVEFTNAGASKFSFSKRRSDVEHLQKLLVSLDEAMTAVYSLSKQARAVLSQREELFFTTRDSHARGPDELDAHMQTVKVNLFQELYSLSTGVTELLEKLKERGVDLRVDWSACAIANLAVVTWRARTGNIPPKSVHADAPGPFGRYLQDLLTALYEELEIGTAPSARSAMRALSNITNSGVLPIGNW